MPSPNPDIRASDADRDRVAELLREHCAQGRITMDELNERLEAVYSSRTLGQLQEVTADLPEQDLYELPVPASHRSTVEPARGGGGILERRGRDVWVTWAVVSAVNLGIWLILAVTGNVVYPWWIWVAGPWGAALIIGTVLGGSRRH